MWTYCLFIAFWGWLADRLGTRQVNAWSVTLWSIAAMFTGVTTGFGSMMASRLALGVGEAASFPTSGKVVRQWFPSAERGLATAIFNAGTFAGPAVSAPAVAWLILKLGWRLSFMITGATGLVWVLLWLKFFRVPAECTWLPAGERDFILDDPGIKAAAAPPVKGALMKLLSNGTIWGLLLTQGCCAYTMLMFLLWLPSYLVQARHMDLMKASWVTAIPYLVAVMVGVPVGRLSDRLLNPEDVKQGKRRNLLIVFILLSSVVILTNLVSNQYMIVALLSMALTCISSALTLNIALTNDLLWNPNMAGTALGITILGGITFGLVAPIVTGYIVKWTGSFDSAFYLAGALLFVGALTAFTMTRKPVWFDEHAN